MKYDAKFLLEHLNCSKLRKIVLVRLPQLPILKQLILEEALFRSSSEKKTCGWVLYNNFTLKGENETNPPYSVVLGRSQKTQDVLYLHSIEQDKVPLVRRYSVGDEGLVAQSFYRPIRLW